MLLIFGISWTAMTFAQSYASNFATLLIPRILMEIFWAASGPISFSLIADIFSQKYRARAVSIYNIGIYLGISLSSLSTLVVLGIGWRNTYRIVSGLSLIITIITFLVHEPKRGRYNLEYDRYSVIEDKISSFRKFIDDIKEILFNSTFLLILSAMTLRYFGAYWLGFWSARYYNAVSFAT